MRYGKNITLILLMLFLLSTAAIAFHHHEDGDHHDCPVCAAGHHYSSASVAIFSITNQQPVSSHEIPKVALLYDNIRVSLLPCRAPPV
jgi:hypothetical protein